MSAIPACARRLSVLLPRQTILLKTTRKKLDSKAADMIVVNPASAIGSTQNQASFVTKNGIEAKELSSKAELAEEIIEALADLLKKRVI